MSSLSQFVPYIPLSYMWILKRSISYFGKTKTVLDVGCGNGLLMSLISQGSGWVIDGIDIHKKYLDSAKKTNIYKKLFLGDVIKETENIIKNKRKYDIVFCSQLIEHLDKNKGVKLLKNLSRIARYRVVVTTPVGYIDQLQKNMIETSYQEHKSGWTTTFFNKNGFEVIGVGPAWLWNKVKIVNKSGEKFLWLLSFISYLFSPFSYFFPNRSASMVCIKNVK